jgi:hypothetical protein
MLIFKFDNVLTELFEKSACGCTLTQCDERNPNKKEMAVNNTDNSSKM